ncbi:hypothetical protein HAX54_011212 [Datura stramonium]|uniref:Ribulose bisphosphate carboxylase small subunit n=1 Tax=Datura stramonium TaxID=4076 RepID=A0ABS8TJ91_DATST|nr:hypothetical protein [Datura stramonium]
MWPLNFVISTARKSNGHPSSKMRCGHQLTRRSTRLSLSYLPDLSDEQLLREIEYLLKNGWVPCLEFETEHGFVPSTTTRQDTTMAGTGPCGSCPCSGALMLPRCWLRCRRPRRLTHKPGSVLSDSTTCVKCSASVSLPVL